MRPLGLLVFAPLWLLGLRGESSGAAAGDAGADAARAGDLDAAMVAREVRLRLGTVKACYERALHDKPSLNGRVDLHWTITITGAVTGVDVQSDTLGDRSVADCLKALVARWKFPPPGGGSVDVTFPFVFQSAGPDAGVSSKPAPAKPSAPQPEVNKLSLGKGAELVTTLTGVDQQNADQSPHLDIVVRRAAGASKVLKLDFTRATHPELADVLEPSFFWNVGAAVLELGPRRAARVALWGRAGEDLMVVQEITILVALEADPKVLWIGLGDRAENQFDTCMVDTTATFRLSRVGKLERKLRSTKTVDRAAKGTVYEDYLKRCKAPPPRTDVFSLSSD